MESGCLRNVTETPYCGRHCLIRVRVGPWWRLKINLTDTCIPLERDCNFPNLGDWCIHGIKLLLEQRLYQRTFRPASICCRIQHYFTYLVLLMIFFLYDCLRFCIWPPQIRGRKLIYIYASRFEYSVWQLIRLLARLAPPFPAPPTRPMIQVVRHCPFG